MRFLWIFPKCQMLLQLMIYTRLNYWCCAADSLTHLFASEWLIVYVLSGVLGYHSEDGLIWIYDWKWMSSFAGWTTCHDDSKGLTLQWFYIHQVRFCELIWRPLFVHAEQALGGIHRGRNIHFLWYTWLSWPQGHLDPSGNGCTFLLHVEHCMLSEVLDMSKSLNQSLHPRCFLCLIMWVLPFK